MSEYKNRWHKISKDFFQCVSFDVILHYGEWHLTTAYGRTIKVFRNPQWAMGYADDLVGN